MVPYCGFNLYFNFYEARFFDNFLLKFMLFVFKKSLPNPRSLQFCLLFSSRNIIVLGLTFRPMIKFKLIFTYDVRSSS